MKKYPDELCRLVIDNMEIIEEAPNVVEHVQEKLFKAINERIEQVTARENWRRCCELCTGDEDKTYFSPGEWFDDAIEYLARYKLSYNEAGEDLYWLSNAIGVNGSTLYLQFSPEKSLSGLKPKEHKKRVQEFYTATPALAEAGFQLDSEGNISLPFNLDAAKTAEEYPDFDEALAPLDTALETLFRVHNDFDGFVKSFPR